jgi:hypothetical protein
MALFRQIRRHLQRSAMADAAPQRAMGSFENEKVIDSNDKSPQTWVRSVKTRYASLLPAFSLLPHHAFPSASVITFVSRFYTFGVPRPNTGTAVKRHTCAANRPADHEIYQPWQLIDPS